MRHIWVSEGVLCLAQGHFSMCVGDQTPSFLTGRQPVYLMSCGHPRIVLKLDVSYYRKGSVRTKSGQLYVINAEVCL